MKIKDLLPIKCLYNLVKLEISNSDCDKNPFSSECSSDISVGPIVIL